MKLTHIIIESLSSEQFRKDLPRIKLLILPPNFAHPISTDFIVESPLIGIRQDLVCFTTPSAYLLFLCVETYPISLNMLSASGAEFLSG